MVEFTTGIISGGLLNIPDKVERMNDFEQEDLVTVRVVKHKKANGEVVFDNTET